MYARVQARCKSKYRWTNNPNPNPNPVDFISRENLFLYVTTVNLTYYPQLENLAFLFPVPVYMCGCSKGGHCNKVSGQCDCDPSYYGDKCETFDYCSYYEGTHNGTSACGDTGE